MHCLAREAAILLGALRLRKAALTQCPSVAAGGLGAVHAGAKADRGVAASAGVVPLRQPRPRGRPLPGRKVRDFSYLTGEASVKTSMIERVVERPIFTTTSSSVSLRLACTKPQPLLTHPPLLMRSVCSSG